MTDKITLTNLVNLQNETTAVNAINSNNQIITLAMDNTLSRDGTAPNQMNASFDMNSNRIINLGAPINSQDAVRLQDLSTITGGGTVANIPAGGTTGQVLAKSSNANYAMVWAASNVGPNTVPNSNLTQAAAATLKGNPTSATANVQDFSISSLTDIVTPNTTLDFIPIHNHTTNTIQKTTITELLAGVGSGVTSIGGSTGVITLGSNLGITSNTINAVSGDLYRVDNFTANLDATFPTVALRMNADWLTLYNPTTKLTQTIFPGSGPSNMICSINGGPGAGVRDNAAAYSSSADVWFYFIWGSGPGLNAINSLSPPTSGPTLPATYTHYAPACLLKIFPGPSLQVTEPQGGGAGPLFVKGKRVFYPNCPFIQAAGYPSGTVDLSPWVPALNTGCDLYVDGEITGAGGPLIAGLVITAAGGGNILNQSLYAPTAGIPAAMDTIIPSMWLPSNRIIGFTYLHSVGTPTNNALFLGPTGYTF